MVPALSGSYVEYSTVWLAAAILNTAMSSGDSPLSLTQEQRELLLFVGMPPLLFLGSMQNDVGGYSEGGGAFGVGL